MAREHLVRAIEAEFENLPDKPLDPWAPGPGASLWWCYAAHRVLTARGHRCHYQGGTVIWKHNGLIVGGRRWGYGTATDPTDVELAESLMGRRPQPWLHCWLGVVPAGHNKRGRYLYSKPPEIVDFAVRNLSSGARPYLWCHVLPQGWAYSPQPLACHYVQALINTTFTTDYITQGEGQKDGLA